ncbi:MAG: MinD/ParA family protein [Gammaproteobacteria bacterium]|nr:MinD/ParA family protein [Gammaproteobacteria bacterium]
MLKGRDQTSQPARIITVTSGKGGVGKTSITVNTGIALAQKGYKVCLFDADSNLANINIMLGVTPEYTLQHVISGEKSIHEILLHKAGLYVVPGASGIADFVGLNLVGQHRLIQALEALENDFDFLLVDTSSGIDNNVLTFVESAHQSVFVITAEPTSLTDAFSLLRVLKKRGYNRKVNIVVNSATTEQRAQRVFSRFADAVDKYLGYRPEFLGSVLKDDLLSSAICLQNPVISYKPTSPSSNGFYRLADAIDKKITTSSVQSLSSHWKQLANINLDTPDFSSSSFEDIAEQPEPKNVEPLTFEDHRHAVVDAIADPSITKNEITGMMIGFMEAYVARFNAYPVDVTKMLYRSLELNTIPTRQINDLLMTLQLTYENNYDYIDQESATNYLCSMVNNYTEKYNDYPFDAVSALYKSLEQKPLSESKMRKLLTTLHLIYQDQYLSAENRNAHSSNLLTSSDEDSGELEMLTAQIQQRHLKNLEQKIQQEFGLKNESKDSKEENLQLVKTERFAPATELGSDVIDIQQKIQRSEETSDDYDALMDSIRYASLID